MTFFPDELVLEYHKNSIIATPELVGNITNIVRSDTAASLWGVSELVIQTLLEKGRAKPATRISSLVWKEFRKKLSPEAKSLIGNAIATAVPTLPSTLFFRFTFGMEGLAKEYYNCNSCLWSEHNYTRDVIQANHGGAIRAYRVFLAQEKACTELAGRVLFLPAQLENQDGFVLFNSYGEGPLQHTAVWASIVSNLLGLHYYPVSMSGLPEGFYTNGGMKQLLVADELPEEEAECTRYRTLSFDHIEDVSPEDCIYCEMATCTRCGRYCLETTYIEFDGEEVCDGCLEDYYVDDIYGEYIPDDEAVFSDRYNGYIHIEEAVEDLNGDFILERDAVYSDRYKGYVHRDDTVVLEDKTVELLKDEYVFWAYRSKTKQPYRIEDLVLVNGLRVPRREVEAVNEG